MLFNIGGGGGSKPSAANFNTCEGVLPKVHIRMRVHAHVLSIHTPMHACSHMYVCMHAQPMQTYILHPNMKIIKINASHLYEKTATKIYKWTRKVLVIYFA